MNLRATTIEHGERFGKLTVLFKSPTRSNYTCGCACGRQIHVTAKKVDERARQSVRAVREMSRHSYRSN